jgi:Ni2+-binding GTPase involved in maturation of urease and hydrogenase
MRYLLLFCFMLLSFGPGCYADGPDATAKPLAVSGKDSTAVKPKVILVGGFLGSGKTTLLRQAAKILIQKGKRVGLVTNDQAPMLVDTKYLKDSELAVKEVAGGCFCCEFSEFADALSDFVRESSPDFMLGEPVGSCTDVSATVLQPLKDRYSHRFTLAPFSVLLDPDKAGIALGEGPRTNLHPSAQYIIRKQVEEADVIVLNKVDMLNKDRQAALINKLTRKFPNAKVFPMSAKTGKGVGEWLNYVMNSSAAGRTITDVDYDTYAQGEAVLGWLNCTAQLKTGSAGDARAFCTDLMNKLRSAFGGGKGEIAHLKMIVEDTNGHIIKANLTSNSGEVSIDGDTWSARAPLTITLNARVQMAPRDLEQNARDILACVAHGGLEITELKSFSPSRPVPTYRYDKVH